MQSIGTVHPPRTYAAPTPLHVVAVGLVPVKPNVASQVMPVGATKEAPPAPYVMVPAPLIVVKIYPIEAGLVLAVGVMQSVGTVHPPRTYAAPTPLHVVAVGLVPV